jgi:hypothetical protein
MDGRIVVTMLNTSCIDLLMNIFYFNHLMDIFKCYVLIVSYLLIPLICFVTFVDDDFG